jgi:hypothetical protein
MKVPKICPEKCWYLDDYMKWQSSSVCNKCPLFNGLEETNDEQWIKFFERLNEENVNRREKV